MTQSPPTAADATAAPSDLGVIEAMRMGWRLLMADFWMLWLLAFVKGAVELGVALATCCLCCLAPIVGFFVEPPLMAGLLRGAWTAAGWTWATSLQHSRYATGPPSWQGCR